jgi:hypothetical protein
MSRKRQILVVGAAIVAFAVVVVSAAVVRMVRQSKFGQAGALLLVYSAASVHYHHDRGRWPQFLHDLESRDPGFPFYVSLENPPIDPWGTPLHYHPFDSALGRGFITSFGPDGKTGGSYSADDLVSEFDENGWRLLTMPRPPD